MEYIVPKEPANPRRETCFLPDTGYTVTGWLHSHNYCGSSLVGMGIGSAVRPGVQRIGACRYTAFIPRRTGGSIPYRVEVLQRSFPIRKTPFDPSFRGLALPSNNNPHVNIWTRSFRCPVVLGQFVIFFNQLIVLFP